MSLYISGGETGGRGGYGPSSGGGGLSPLTNLVTVYQIYCVLLRLIVCLYIIMLFIIKCILTFFLLFNRIRSKLW